MRRRLGDRRIRPRYDIVGDLRGTVEAVLRLPLKNVGLGGALIESHVPLPSESVHRLTFACDGVDAGAQVRVRHVSPQVSADGERTFLIGVEFLTLHPALEVQVRGWLESSDTASAAEV